MKEFQVWSGSVSGLPSVSALRMAVTGRQKSKAYLASQAQMAASAMARFNNANKRAFSSRVLRAAALMSCAMLFQWPGGVSVPAPSAQKRAIWDWSAVRVEMVFAPSCFTSLTSAAYLSLVRAGGPGGRNSELVVMQKGLRN